MPASYTHHLFTNDVFKALNKETSFKISDNQNVFNLFGKSFDILFFTNHKLGCYAHNHNVNLYFENIIKFIIDNNLKDNSQVLAYLYGSICHYILDSTAHPYIYYKTGVFKRQNKKTHKYRGNHDYYEYMIDAILFYERNNKMIYKAKMKEELFSKINFSDELKRVIDYAYLTTFNQENGAMLVKSGCRNYKFVVAHVMTSRFGLKYHLFKVTDFFKIPNFIKLSNCNYHIKKLDYSVLNNERLRWCYPVDKKIYYHYSFNDLYDIAIIKASKIINDLDIAFNKESKDIKKVLREIGNLSYSTGRNANKEFIMKYFDY